MTGTCSARGKTAVEYEIVVGNLKAAETVLEICKWADTVFLKIYGRHRCILH
jgi:hypothetical protein